jgi:DNA replication protein DnaC
MVDVCSICKGLGLQIVQRPDGTQFAQDCVCRIELRKARLLKNARIPRRYQLCSLDSFETMHSSATKSVKKALSMSRKFAEGYPVETAGKGLLFVGPKGLGKTHLAIGILKNLIADRGATGVFWEHKELLENLRSIYSLRTAGAEAQVLKSVITCDLLVLDDLGDITPSDWTWDTTSYILSSRYNEDRSTIITSNLPNEASSISLASESPDRYVNEPSKEARRAMMKMTLADRVGDRIWSRLQEMCVAVEMQGEDFRQKVKRASFA